MLLKESNADPNKPTADDGTTPLCIAAGNGHAGVVEMLLEDSNTDANQPKTNDGSTPLFVAAENGHAGVVSLLLEKGNADPNLATTDDGTTPLCIAAGNGHVEIVTALLKGSNADPNQAMTLDGTTPLCMAAGHGHGAVVTALLKRGTTDVNQATTDDGSTPLCMAAQEGHVAIVRQLLENNADPGIARLDGAMPVDIAASKGHKAVVALLSPPPKKSKKWQWDKDSKRKTATAAVSNADVVADMAASKSQLPDITVRTLTGDYTGKFVIWAGGEFQYPNSIPNTIRVGHGSKYAAYADLPCGDHVVIGGSESGIDIAHFLIGLGDTVTVLDDTAPWNSRESDSSLGCVHHSDAMQHNFDVIIVYSCFCLYSMPMKTIVAKL